MTGSLADVQQSAAALESRQFDVDSRWMAPHRLPVANVVPPSELAIDDPLAMSRGVLFGVLACAPVWAAVSIYAVYLLS